MKLKDYLFYKYLTHASLDYIISDCGIKKDGREFSACPCSLLSCKDCVMKVHQLPLETCSETMEKLLEKEVDEI